jgi:hypothetical protein
VTKLKPPGAAGLLQEELPHEAGQGAEDRVRHANPLEGLAPGRRRNLELVDAVDPMSRVEVA